MDIITGGRGHVQTFHNLFCVLDPSLVVLSIVDVPIHAYSANLNEVLVG
jgi:hypothetical protein